MLRTITKIITLILLVGVSLWSYQKVYSYYQYLGYPRTSVVIGNTVFGGYMAVTPHDRAQGLSNKLTFPVNTLMLFVFDEADLHGIWMKDMNFPIDIVWLDGYKKVVHVLADVDPASYPHVFVPPKKALYVLELPSGTVARQALKVGDSVYFDTEDFF